VSEQSIAERIITLFCPADKLFKAMNHRLDPESASAVTVAGLELQVVSFVIALSISFM
jgi:hypothetical protein